jgi:predicted NAD/FAD-dependent oxidoreductase
MLMTKATQEALRLYGIALLEYERYQITQISTEVTPEEQKLITYALSTQNRRYFLNLATTAAFEEKPILVSQCAKLLGISRNAADVIYRECLDAGWITVDRSKKGHRYIQATEMLVKLQMQYAREMVDVSYQTGITPAAVALKFLLEQQDQ